MNRGRRGFTLIELLVVIGIITVLLAILIPVVSRVRLSAQTASTTAEMHRISAAIGNYFNDFQAYPGVWSNQSFAGGAKPFKPMSGTYTQSEDLVMALLGGFQIDSGTKQLSLVQNQIGLGPMNFNTVVVSPRKNAYIDKIPSELTPLGANGVLVPSGQVVELSHSKATDSEVPEFIDAYSQPRPIIYVRANPSATPTNVIYNSKVSGSFRADVQYDVAALQPYLKNPTDYPPTTGAKCDFPIPGTSSYGFNGQNLDPNNGAVKSYFTATGSTTAKNVGSYLLLDAGADRIFGTDDDIIVGAGGGQ